MEVQWQSIQWRDGSRQPKYEVSNQGELKSWSVKRRGASMSPRRNTSGYMQVCLRVDGETWYPLVHVLVMAVFGPPKPTPRHRINHIDGNKRNNRIENLEWVTTSENNQHAYKLGLKSVRGERNPQAVLTDDEVRQMRGLHAQGLGATKIGRLLGRPKSTVDNVIYDGAWSHVS
jgi:hypothetical protein